MGGLNDRGPIPKDEIIPHEKLPIDLDLEFAYTPFTMSCRDLYTIDKLCRRPAGHEGTHAAGFGKDRAQWEQADTTRTLSHLIHDPSKYVPIDWVDEIHDAVYQEDVD